MSGKGLILYSNARFFMLGNSGCWSWKRREKGCKIQTLRSGEFLISQGICWQHLYLKLFCGSAASILHGAQTPTKDTKSSHICIPQYTNCEFRFRPWLLLLTLIFSVTHAAIPGFMWIRSSLLACRFPVQFGFRFRFPLYIIRKWWLDPNIYCSNSISH